MDRRDAALSPDMYGIIHSVENETGGLKPFKAFYTFRNWRDVALPQDTYGIIHCVKNDIGGLKPFIPKKKRGRSTISAKMQHRRERQPNSY